jgi:hypothetical protein
VLPLFGEDRLQAAAHRVAVRLRVARLGDRFGHPGQRGVGEPGEHLAHGGHPVRAQREHLVQRRPGGPVPRDVHLVGHLVVRQPQRVPRRRPAQDRAADPGVGGEDEVAQRLDEGILVVDPLVQQVRVHPAGPVHGLLPQPLEDIPGLAVPVRIGRAHLGAIRVAAVEFGLHQGHDVDPVDRDVLEQAVDFHVHQERAADHGVRQVDVAEPGAGEVDLLEPGAGQVLPGEVSHPASLPGCQDI